MDWTVLAEVLGTGKAR